MIVEISAVPIGVGESLSSYVAKVIEVLKEEGVNYNLGPMGTSFEVENFKRLAEILEKLTELCLRLDHRETIMLLR